MAEIDVTPAESSPAPAAPAAEPAVPSEKAAYDHWRRTGEVKPKAESAPAKKSSDTKPAGAGEGEGDQASGTAPESETGKKQEHKPSKAEARLNELLEDLRKAGFTPAELKTFRKEAAKTDPSRAAEKALEEHTDKPAGKESGDKAPVRPKESDYKTWEEYEAARDKYFEDLADYKANQAVVKDRESRAREAAEKDMLERVNKAKERYGEGADVTIVSTAKTVFNDQAIPGVIRQMAGDSPVLVDLMYALGSDAAKLAEFVDLAKTNPSQALRKLIVMEGLVQQELAKSSRVGGDDAPVRDESGKFVSDKPPEKKTTSAPPPPKAVSGRSGPPADEVASAVDAGDFRSYREAANRRDLARRKGM